MKKGVFIVVDGIDGSGKTEIIKLLHNYLFTRQKKTRILTTREPTDGFYGMKIRKILREEKNPRENSAKLIELFLKDRKEHLEKTIEPFLRYSNEHELNIVLCDRYYHSTIAFQGAQGLDIKKLIEKNKSFLKPDIAFILDVEPSIALERIEYREKEKFEQINFLKKVRENFLRLPKLLNENIKIINASKNIKDVFEDVKKEIFKMFLRMLKKKLIKCWIKDF